MKKLELVDSGTILKLLLEYYRGERLNVYKLLKDLFLSQNGKFVNGNYVLGY